MRKLNGLSNKRFKHVVEPACGAGGFTEIVLANIAGFDRYLAIDPSERAEQAFAKTIAHPKVEFIRADALQEVPRHGPFDLAVLSNSMHHFARPLEILGVLRDSLGPDGVLLVNEMYADLDRPGQILQLEIHAFAAEIDRAGGTYHGRPLTRAEQLKDLASAGFTVQSEEDFTSDEEPLRDSDYDDSIAQLFDMLRKRVEALPDIQRSNYLDRLEDLRRQAQSTMVEAPPQLARWCVKTERRI